MSHATWCLAIALMLLAFEDAAFGKTGKKKSATNVKKFTVKEQKAAKKFWTPERMDSAKPLEMTWPKNSSVQRSSRGSSQPIRVDIEDRPYWNVGKLFFTQNGEKKHCTAQFVFTKHVLVTAASCLYNPNKGWLKDLAFRQQYVGRGQKYRGKEIKIYTMAVPQRWKDWGAQDANYGVISTITPSKAGYLGFKEFFGSSMQVTAVGYSETSDPGFGLFRQEGRLTASASFLRMTPNTLGRYSIGGAIIRNADPHGVGKSYNQLVSINSYFDPDGKIKGSMFGPYIHTKDIQDLLWLIS